MSAPDPSRRTVLAGLSTIALGALAGCSSLLGGSDEDESAYRNWLYDQSHYTDEKNQASLWFDSPTELMAAEDHIPNPVINQSLATPLRPRSDLASIDWAIWYHNELGVTPGVRAFGGSFDSNTAREMVTAMGPSVDDDNSPETVDEYELVAYDDDQYGLYRDGEAVFVESAASEDVVRDLVTERSKSPSKLADSIQQFIDRVGFETTASVQFEPTDGTEFTGTGTGYTVDGQTTDVRYVHLNGDLSVEDLQEVGHKIEALSAVTVDEEGPVRWLEGTVDTDRTALNGTMFDQSAAPFE